MAGSTTSRIAIVTAGTRGDVQPAIAIGKALSAAGYSATVVAGTNFGDWVRSHELGFEDLGLDIDEVMASDEAKAWKRSRQVTELYNMKGLMKLMTEPAVDALTKILPDFDAIVTGGTVMPIAAAVSKAREIPLFFLLKQPMYPTKSGSALAMALRPNTTSWLNLLAKPVMLHGFWYAYCADGMRLASERMGQPEPSYRDFKDVYLNTPTFVAITPPVLPPPEDYPPHVHVTGYLFVDEADDWVPPSDLSDFLGAGPPPVYVGFGSMTDGGAEQLTPLLVDALEGRRAILGGGLSTVDADSVPDSIHLLRHAPHEWLFPRMRALVHHGGSGTTANGLRAGKPTLVVPHFFDQYYFGRRCKDLCVGPPPLPRRKLNSDNLRRSIDRLCSDESFAEHARAVSENIHPGESPAKIVELIAHYVR